MSSSQFCLKTLRLIVAAYRNRKKAAKVKENSVVYVSFVTEPHVSNSDSSRLAMMMSTLVTNASFVFGINLVPFH